MTFHEFIKVHNLFRNIPVDFAFDMTDINDIERYYAKVMEGFREKYFNE